MKKCVFLLLSIGLFSGCNYNPPDEMVKGYKPIYISKENAYQIAVQSPRSLKNPGKIYSKDGILFVNEQGKGIHIIDNHNPSSPVSLRFLSIPGNTDMAVKGNVLYANNFDDLVTIDLSNTKDLVVLKRIDNVFPQVVTNYYPPFDNVKFECPDASKGIIVEWEETTLKNPKCYR
jgi:hypothetical protein